MRGNIPMSGHSKWSKVKHQKATTDVVKARAFTTAARLISIAVREGGGVTDPNHNFRLRLAIDKARQDNVPKENIERAIERGGGVGAAHIEQLIYEAYGPHNIAILIETLTDNRQRTVSFVKNFVENSGGVLAAKGAVSYQFTQMGYLHVSAPHRSFDDLFEHAVLAGASDIEQTDDGIDVYCSVNTLHTVGKTLSCIDGVTVDSQSIIMKPTMPMAIKPDQEEEISEFISGLEELEDVSTVYTNAIHM